MQILGSVCQIGQLDTEKRGSAEVSTGEGISAR